MARSYTKIGAPRKTHKRHGRRTKRDVYSAVYERRLKSKRSRQRAKQMIQQELELMLREHINKLIP